MALARVRAVSAIRMGSSLMLPGASASMSFMLASGRVCLGFSMRDTSTLVKAIGFNPAPADQPLLIFGVGDLHVASGGEPVTRQQLAAENCHHAQHDRRATMGRL